MTVKQHPDDKPLSIVAAKHEERVEMLKWCGSFHPESFIAEKVTKELRKVK